MEVRKLGANGPKVSSLGIGAMSFADFYGPTTEENSYAILDAAMEAGVTHIDTANVYGMGRSETAIGEFLKTRGTEARDHFVIATKASISRGADGARSFNNDPEHFEAELDKSLERLGVECVDLFYMHRLAGTHPIEEVVDGLAALVKKGKTKSIGLSEIAPSTLRRAVAVHPIAAVQSEYSLATRAPELGLIQACEETGTAFVAFSPVARSFLTDTPLSDDTAKDLIFLKTNPRFLAPNYAYNIAATDRFRALAAEMGMPSASLAIAWTLRKGDHVLPIPGTRSTAHFAELVKGANVTLSDADMQRIEDVLPVGWAHGDRYSVDQWVGPERYC